MRNEVVPLHSKTQQQQSQTDAPLCCAQSVWLTEWRSANDRQIPAHVRARLPELKLEAERALRPASAPEFLVALDRLWEFAETFGLPAEKTEAATKMYREALMDIPADVLVNAIRRTTETWSYRSLPLPADIRKNASEELSRRQLIRSRIKIAEMYARWQTT